MTKPLQSAAFLLSILYLFSGGSTTYVPETVDCGPLLATPDSGEEILTNDNRVPAGQLINGVLYLNLEAREGNWYPESKEGLPIKVYAFAEAGKPMQLPGPLIRVPEGTEIKVTVRNLTNDTPFVLYGFHSRPGIKQNGVIIPYGETYKASFKAGVMGTYFYRATSGNRIYNGLPYHTDSQLYGAFIVDSKNHKPDPAERIFMIGIWNDTITDPDKMPNEELAINGLSWPFTERLTYNQHQAVKWRIINASNQSHPMHLHGFYYTLNSKGNEDSDTIFTDDSRRVVTELIHPHETRTLTWVPEKSGNWLFHCHTLVHIIPFSFLRTMPEMDEHQKNDETIHANTGMGGLIMGIHVLPAGMNVQQVNNRAERKLTLVAREQLKRFGDLPSKGFVLYDGDTAPSDQQISIPGPAIILKRNEPVAINIVNKLRDATTIHWHGLEIESYFDGAAPVGEVWIKN